jgi:hypothetical protein
MAGDRKGWGESTVEAFSDQPSAKVSEGICFSGFWLNAECWQPI